MGQEQNINNTEGQGVNVDPLVSEWKQYFGIHSSYPCENFKAGWNAAIRKCLDIHDDYSRDYASEMMRQLIAR